MISPLPLSLYVHYPFCIRKCPYCDFNSVKKTGEVDAVYLQSLLNDYREVRAYLNGRKLTSVYLGGGTPSLFPLKQLSELMELILPDCESDCEISIEANPGTIELSRLREYRTMGITRLSLGVQSFSTQSLRRLGRIYDGSTALKACEMVRQAGFVSFNFDLMHGIPGQSVADGLSDLQTALSFDPPHLSWYELTIEEGTPFAVNHPALPQEETLLKLEEEGMIYLKEQGLSRYEVSGYATCMQTRCRHNLNYWYFGDYLGIGAGAHSKLFVDGHTLRKACPDEVQAYLKNRGEYVAVEPSALPFEFLLNRLRVFEPVDLSSFAQTTGLSLDMLRSGLLKAQDMGLLKIEGEFETLKLTELGKTMLNDILMLFLT